MARCPFGKHRLALDEKGKCRTCQSDLSLYAASVDLPVAFYNNARRCWDALDLNASSAWLEASLQLREQFLEAHWLLGAVKIRCGDYAGARTHLARAQELGAPVDPSWAAMPEPAPAEESLNLSSTNEKKVDSIAICTGNVQSHLIPPDNTDQADKNDG